MSTRPPPGAERTAGASLGDQQLWLEAVLDLLHFPALLVEPGSARVVFVNQAARAAPLEPPDGHLTDEAGRPVAPEQLPTRRAARGERLDGLAVTRHAAGGAASFVVFSGTVPAMHGHTPLAVVTYLDVTPLKAAEADLRRAVQDRDEFFSVATHELKDPLFSLQLSLELLRLKSTRQAPLAPEALAQHLEVCKRQSDRLARLIDNLLDVSRIANKRLQLDLDAFDLCELAQEVVGRFQEQARAAGVTLGLDAGPPTIGYWDRLKVEQVLVNLLSNALKYGGGQPVCVRVRADEESALLEVEDHGPGIPEADQGRIFERFERAARGHQKESLGLGLFIVRSLVEAHGGRVRLRSAPGQGATFTVELPRKRLLENNAELPTDG